MRSLALDLPDGSSLVTGGARGIGLGITEALRRGRGHGRHLFPLGRRRPAARDDPPVCDVRDPEAVAGPGRRDRRRARPPRRAGQQRRRRAVRRCRDGVAAVPRQDRRAQPARAAAGRAGRQRGDAGAGRRRRDREHLLDQRPPAVARRPPRTARPRPGLDSLTRSLAIEWAPKVRVNAIDVGLCRTEQTADHYGGDARSPRSSRPSRWAGWRVPPRSATWPPSSPATSPPTSAARASAATAGASPRFLHVE